MPLRAGARLGPYHVVEPLGAGGMGEVYRARDTRLGRDVAVKVLPAEHAGDPERLQRFHQEARAAAALSHPNIVAVYDVGSEDGVVHVVFELLEGETLRAALERGTLTPRRVLEDGLQICHGLAAAHARGIVHRDLKPENVFLTVEGQVKLLDFGLARLGEPRGGSGGADTARTATEPGVVLGTRGYMSPEQARGQGVDGRSDIFSLGAMLYEMLSGRRAFEGETPADTLSAILHHDPPPIAGAAEPIAPGVERVIRQCVEKKAEDRFQSAGDVGLALRALSDVAQGGDRFPRLEGARPGEERPYPGLSAFTEADTNRFFGREEDVQALWEKVRRQKLLAVIGPSGVGKTSFLRAGMIPQRPSGWAVLYATPGSSPALALGRTLSAELAGDAVAVAELLDAVTAFTQEGEPDRLVGVLSRWRRRQGEALLVLDQFEELFTLSPRETQDLFAALLGRIVEEADVHVLLSLRDDFLFRCHAHPALFAVFLDLTPLGAPTPPALKRALEEPATQLGVRFDDPSLADEMVSTVASERAALPLLAFAAARLWEERDRDRKLLTREAYERIGGVAGALARHAEATLRRIGPEREGVVREILRNLVTSTGTRGARGRGELLSVFGTPEGDASARRREAEEVLDALIEARLLTEYEAGAGTSAPRERGMIEVVHESLLTHWPRLERWRAQDEEGALLRDQLRQAAQAWHDRGRPEDLLWSGASYREFSVWKERYPGGLTAVESAFGEAMHAHATRRRRRRRAAVAAVITALTMGLGVIAGLWVRAERAREAAQAEALRREADQLLALGRLYLRESPSEALAYAIASLERSDNEPARHFAVAALWQGPTQSVFATADTSAFGAVSPDGQWAALTTADGVKLWSRQGGEARKLAFASKTNPLPWVAFSGDGHRVVVTHPRERMARVFSVEDGREVRTIDLGEGRFPWGLLRGDRVVDLVPPGPDERAPEGTVWVRVWSLSGEGPRKVGRWMARGGMFTLDAAGTAFVELRREGVVTVRRLESLESEPRPLGRHEGAFEVSLHPSGTKVYTDGKDDIRLWELEARSPSPVRSIRAPRGTTFCNDWGLHPQFDPTGRVLAAWLHLDGGSSPCTLATLDLEGPPDAAPLALTHGQTLGFGFDPSGRWLFSAHNARSFLWSVSDRRPRVLRVPGLQAGPSFTPDGRFVAAGSETEMRLWPLTAAAGEGVRTLYGSAKRSFQFGSVAFDPRGRFLATAGDNQDEVFVLPLPAGRPRRFRVPGTWVQAVAVSPQGRSVAAAYVHPQRAGSARIHVWDLEAGAETVLDPRAPGEDCASGSAWEGAVASLAFLPDGALLSAGNSGLRLWNVEGGEGQRLRECEAGGGLPVTYWSSIAVAPAARLLAQVTGFKLTVFDLEHRSRREITTHGTEVEAVALDPNGETLVTGDRSGVVRAGPVGGGEPHLFFGHTSGVSSVSVSPDGRWIASASWTQVAGDNRVGDQTIRLWPLPEGPPLHTLPRAELLAKLRSSTNLRVVPAPGSATGYRIEPGPFPGWAKAAEW